MADIPVSTQVVTAPSAASLPIVIWTSIVTPGSVRPEATVLILTSVISVPRSSSRGLATEQSSVLRTSTTPTSSPTLGSPSPNATIITYAPNPGLSTGAKAGIGIGATFGVLIIAIVAFLLGSRARRKPAHHTEPQNRPHDATWESKAELHGHDRPTPELEGRGISRWWSKRFSRHNTVKALNEADPQELPAEDVKAPNTVHQAQIHHADLPELRTV